jgi:hypothetical protein
LYDNTTFPAGDVAEKIFKRYIMKLIACYFILVFVSGCTSNKEEDLNSISYFPKTINELYDLGYTHSNKVPLFSVGEFPKYFRKVKNDTTIEFFYPRRDVYVKDIMFKFNSLNKDSILRKISKETILDTANKCATVYINKNKMTYQIRESDSIFTLIFYSESLD